MVVTHLYILDSDANTNQTRVGIFIDLASMVNERFNASETSCWLENSRYMNAIGDRGITNDKVAEEMW